jgi:DNA end-binding protein Ku
MASVAKGVALSVGLIGVTIRVESAVNKAESFTTLCVGQSGKAHDPTPIKMPRKCESCGEIADYSTLAKGRKSSDGYVVVTADEVAALKVDDERYKKSISLVPHPADEVYGATAQGDKLYQLHPDGDADRYALIGRLIDAHPEFAFLTLYTVRSRASLYVARVKDGVVLLEERVRHENLKPLPQLDGAVNEALLGMAEQLLGTMATPFDPESYADGYQRALDELIASRDAVAAGASPELATVTPLHQSDDELMAKLAALATGGTKAAPRKRAAKKSTAA